MAVAESMALAQYEVPAHAPNAETIKRAAGAANMPDEQFQVFLAIARRTGLDPLARQIYAIPRQTRKKDDKGKWQTETAWTIQTGIDGYRVIAARTGQLAGIDDPVFDSEDSAHPLKATCTVYRFTQGQRVPFTASARWSEYVQTKAVYEDGERTDKTQPTELWARMPYLMLGKCAEALALRRAFPAELSGVYTGEEMAQADNYVEAAATVHEEPSATAPVALPAPQTVEQRYEAERPQRDAIAQAAQKSVDAAARTSGNVKPAPEPKYTQDGRPANWSTLQLWARQHADVATQQDWEDCLSDATGKADPKKMTAEDFRRAVPYFEEMAAKKARAEAKVTPASEPEPSEPDVTFEPATLDLADIETGHPVP